MKNQTVWRYFSLTKFIDFVEGNLYFTRGDKFEDKFEGRLTLSVIKKFEEIFNYNPYSDYPDHPNFNEIEKNGEMHMDLIRKKELENRKKVFICCWHLNDVESDAMWKLYSEKGYGLVVKSSTEKLEKFIVTDQLERVIAPIKYIDYNTYYEENLENYELYTFLFKRKSFDFEKELRVILFPDDYKTSGELSETGLKVSFSFDDIVDEVIASPYMKNWEFELIKKMLNRYNVIIKQSTLNDDIKY